jgi:uncharacterized membrane protein YtjA (UPF0391 family)
MLKRAANCVVIAIIAAIFGFTGILHWTAVIAQSVCVVCLGFCVLSLLFSLFEEPSRPAARQIRLSAADHHGVTTRG